MKQIHETPPPVRDVEPHLPAFLGEAIEKCLAKDANERFQSVEELEASLSERPAQTAGAVQTELAKPTPELVQWGRLDYVWTATALVSLVVFWKLFFFVSPPSYGKVSLDKRAAEIEAGRLFELAGWKGAQPRVTGSNIAYPRLSPAVISRLANPVSDLPIVAGQEAGITWVVSWPSNGVSLQLDVDADGTPRSFTVFSRGENFEKEARATAGPTLGSSEERARLASKFLSGFFSADPAQLKAETVDRDAPDWTGFEIHDFTWISPKPDRLGWTERYEIKILGSSLWQGGHYSMAPWEQVAFNGSVWNWSDHSVWVYLVLSILLLPVFLLGRVYRKVRWPPIVFFVTFILAPQIMSLLDSWWLYPLDTFSLIQRIVLWLFLGLLFAWIFLTLEYLINVRWPEKWASFRFLLRCDFKPQSGVPLAVFRGAALASTALGVYALLRYAGLRFKLSPWVPNGLGSGNFDAFSPSLLTAFGCLRTDLYATLLLLALLIIYLKRFFRSSVLLVTSVGLLWLLTGMDFSFAESGNPPNVWFEYAVVFTMASIASWVFVRYDLLTLLAFSFAFHFVMPNSVLWKLFREIGNTEQTLAFVLLGGVVALSLASYFRQNLMHAYRRAIISFQ